jgi:DNA modification methylase
VFEPVVEYRHKLIAGDCTDAATVARVMDGEKADVVFTDPPYKMGTQGGDILPQKRLESHERIKDIVDFDPEPFLEMLPDLFDGRLCAFVFCNKELLPDYLLWARDNKINFNVLVWKKSVVVPFGDSHRPDIEYLILFRKNAKWNNGLAGVSYSRLLEYSSEQGDHPTIKPADLIQNQLLIVSDAGDLIVDTYLGSGSTMVACENLQRRCRAIEINPAYVAVALERMAQAFPGISIKRINN